jgi:hypothetical protein
MQVTSIALGNNCALYTNADVASIYKQQFFCRTYSIAVNTTVSNVMSTVALLTKAILTLQYFLNLSVSIQNKYRNFKPVEITLRRGLM